MTVSSASDSLGWTDERTTRALDHLLSVGIAWKDEQAAPVEYWFPAFFQQTVA